MFITQPYDLIDHIQFQVVDLRAGNSGGMEAWDKSCHCLIVLSDEVEISMSLWNYNRRTVFIATTPKLRCNFPEEIHDLHFTSSATNGASYEMIYSEGKKNGYDG